MAVIWMSDNYLIAKVIVHHMVTEKVPARYRSLKMADASLGKY